MFANHVCNNIEILATQGKDPTHNWKLSQHVQRIYDRCIKGFIYVVGESSTPGVSLQFPNDSKKRGLGITHAFFVFQIWLTEVEFLTEDVVLGASDHRRRLKTKNSLAATSCLWCRRWHRQMESKLLAPVSK